MALDISLAQFSKIASGDYNAGQIDITTNKYGTAELVKINNHVWKTGENKVILSPERILEVKEAFLNALQKAGVSKAKLAEVRDRLGLIRQGPAPQRDELDLLGMALDFRNSPEGKAQVVDDQSVVGLSKNGKDVPISAFCHRLTDDVGFGGFSLEDGETFKPGGEYHGRVMDRILNAEDPVAEGGLARQVTVASGDRVGALFRSQDAKDVNNVTRDIFRNAIADMFGGESKIPDSIKEAMNMKKFDGSGRPLTAKRIMNVKIAIDQYNAQNPGTGIKVDGPGADIIAQGLNGNAVKMDGVKAMSAASAAKDMRPVTLTQKTAEKMIGKSLDLFGYTFPKDQKAEFAELLVKNGNGMPAKNLRMLSNYIANKAIVESTVDEEDVANLARDMKTWTEFKFGDARLNPLSAKFVERQNNYVKLMINNPSKFCADHPDVFAQVSGDAHRCEWNINGKIFKRPSPEQVAQRQKEVMDEFLKAVTNPNARKVISILMNQGNLADLECLFNKSPALVGDPNAQKMQFEDIHTIPGGEMFVSRSGATLLADYMPSYGVEISKDGTTATVTVSIDKDVSSMGGKFNETKIGTAKITQRAKIDLTKPMPEVVDVTFSQTYTPGKIRYNPNIEKLNI